MLLDQTGLPEGFLDVVGVVSATEERIARFLELLSNANSNMNLVGASTLETFWTRHVLDCAQLAWFAPEKTQWADLGSGAGLPGLILAILLKNRPGACVHLVESMTKRCRFLSAVVDDLQLPAVVHNERAERLRLNVQVVTARACAPLDRLLGYAQPYLDRGALGLFLKGAEVDNEITEARKTWNFRHQTVVSLSDPRGRLLFIEELTRDRSR